jgi:hypothetical protein
MLSIKLIALVALAGLAQSESFTLILPDQVKDPAASQVAENLRLGAVAPHVSIDLLDEKTAKVQLTALNDCQCFGRLVKAGEAVAVLDFPNGTAPSVALALTELLISGKLHDKVQASAPVRSGRTAAAAPAPAQPPAPPAGGQQQGGQQPPAGGQQQGGQQPPAGPATAGGNRQS